MLWVWHEGPYRRRLQEDLYGDKKEFMPLGNFGMSRRFEALKKKKTASQEGT